jgi:hypothetical protein
MGGGFKSMHPKQAGIDRSKSILHQQDLLKNAGLGLNPKFPNSNATPSPQVT